MSFFGDLMGGSAAKAASNYNAALLDRDAKVKEMQADQAYKVYTTYELPKFNYQATKSFSVKFSYPFQNSIWRITHIAHLTTSKYKLLFPHHKILLFQYYKKLHQYTSQKLRLIA